MGRHRTIGGSKDRQWSAIKPYVLNCCAGSDHSMQRLEVDARNRFLADTSTYSEWERAQIEDLRQEFDAA